MGRQVVMQEEKSKAPSFQYLPMGHVDAKVNVYIRSEPEKVMRRNLMMLKHLSK